MKFAALAVCIFVLNLTVNLAQARLALPQMYNTHAASWPQPSEFKSESCTTQINDHFKDIHQALKVCIGTVPRLSDTPAVLILEGDPAVGIREAGAVYLFSQIDVRQKTSLGDYAWEGIVFTKASHEDGMSMGFTAFVNSQTEFSGKTVSKIRFNTNDEARFMQANF